MPSRRSNESFHYSTPASCTSFFSGLAGRRIVYQRGGSDARVQFESSKLSKIFTCGSNRRRRAHVSSRAVRSSLLRNRERYADRLIGRSFARGNSNSRRPAKGIHV